MNPTLTALTGFVVWSLFLLVLMELIPPWVPSPWGVSAPRGLTSGWLSL